jgi:ATP-binding cassette subfamily F protein 3
MAILTTQSVGHAFGATELFHELTVTVEERDRIGLVGPNGVGKTTLLLILAGLLEPTGGSVERAERLTVGFLREEALKTFAGRDNTVYEEMLTAFSDLLRREEELATLEAKLAAAYSPEVLERYGELQSQYEHAGGYQYQVDIKRVLLGLGFDPAQWDTPLLQLSEGQKTRLLLGRLLLEKPGLLVLDEPTNHLDIAAIEWLESTLRSWDGALILISHDRFFLDRVVNKVWEMLPAPGDNPAEVNVFRGNYSAYLRQREEARERANRLYLEEKERLESEAEFILTHIAGGQTDIAKGRLRQLTRDLALIEQIGIVEMAEIRRSGRSWIEVGSRAKTLSINEAIEKIRAIRPPFARAPRLTINLDTLERSARIVLRAKNALFGFPGRPLFTTGRLKLERGSRVALLGPNGSGKSTMLRTIRGELPLLDGDLELGKDVKVGYFAQTHAQLVRERRVIDELWARRNMNETDARSWLAGYQFRGDDVFKRVSELSGGERGRLALALLALEEANFLLLDEPTNHLDIPSQEVLQDVLESFNGTILLVSHDRYLIDRLAREIWAIEGEQLIAYPASYKEYLALRDGLPAAAGAEAADETPTAPVAVASAPTPPLPTGWSREARRLSERRRRQLEEELEEIEMQVAQAGEMLEAIRPSGDAGQIAQWEEAYARAREQLEERLAEWELLA